MTDQETFYAPERILVIVAHSDDIEFGMAGSVARWTAEGSQVTYCVVTDNAAGSNDPATVRDTLIETRRREQMEAAAVVGVQDVRFLGYPDGMLQPTMELRRDLTRLIREVKPQLVITMDPTTIFTKNRDYINHPDHRAVGEAAVYAAFPSAGSRPIFPELLEEGYEPHNVSRIYMTLSNEPTLFIDVSETYERKVEALRCHASQLNEDIINMIRTWNAEAGKAMGFGYAEVFSVINLDRAP